MYIHLADTSNNRGQYDLLIEENHVSTLYSYAYKGILEREACAMWQKMYIHLAGNATQKSQQESLLLESQPNHLMSYAYKSCEKGFKNVWESQPARVIIDSGAFTVHSTGKTINPKDYGLWALEFRKQWEHKMKVLYFMNLDVIGDQEGTWRNQKILEAMGLNPLPIITVGASKKDIVYAISNYDYVAFGGLHDRKTIKSWLNYCFALIMKQYKETGKLVKTHLLAQTTEWILKDYPCYSSDSSTWTGCLRFGDGSESGIKLLPRYKESDGALAATIHTLRSEIRKYKKMEYDMTKLWESRGIVWND